MSDRQKWESILTSVIEDGHRKKRQRVIVLLSSVATLFLLVFSVMLYYQSTENGNTINQQRIAINDPELEMEMALMEQGIIVDDMGIIY